MKGSGKLIAALLVLALAACLLAGCGLGSAETQIKKAVVNMTKAKSYDVAANLTMRVSWFGVSEVGVSIIRDRSWKGSYFSDPMKMVMSTFAMDTFGEEDSVLTEEYFIAEGDTVTIYIYGFGDWIKTNASDQPQKLQQYDINKSLDLYSKGAKNFVKVGTEKIDGIMTDVLEGFVSGTDMLDYMDSMLGMLYLPQPQETAEHSEVWEALKALCGNMQDMPLKLWIDTKTHMPVQYYMYMTEALDAVGNAVGKAMPEGHLIDETITACKITVRIRNINKATDFSLPAEALAV